MYRKILLAFTAAILMTGVIRPGIAEAAKLRCKTVIGDVEGFFHDSIKSTAQRSRDKAIAAEKAHRRDLGQRVVKVELGETTCKETYPIGLKEWYCVAKAKVCFEK